MLVVAFFSIPIIISDLTRNKIPNVYLQYLAYCLVVITTIQGFGQVKTLIFSIFLLFILSLFGVGMGDLKLIALMIFYENPYHSFDIFYFLFLLLAISSLHVIFSCGRLQQMPKKIPLAPSIFLTYAAYLATK